MSISQNSRLATFPPLGEFHGDDLAQGCDAPPLIAVDAGVDPNTTVHEQTRSLLELNALP
ncbi:hypothetical protein [Labrys sp. (in: a-proteobacteria)]|uniref:hypothetical protein n=1 Tax=Labrys sp. (in: a-proteobacteria) TaxID=1917972 RepID=UPI0039E71C35